MILSVERGKRVLEDAVIVEWEDYSHSIQLYAIFKKMPILSLFTGVPWEVIRAVKRQYPDYF